MANYTKGKVYIMRSFQTNETYIGSTIQSLAERKGGHVAAYKAYLKGKCRFTTSFNIVKFDDCYIELLEEYPCKNRMELERREGHFIRSIECVNRCVAGRTKKEWHDDNEERVKERMKEYQKEHKEFFKEYNKEYYQSHKEKMKKQIKEYQKQNKYFNKDKIKEYQEKIKDRLSEKITCSCGSVLTKGALGSHLKTKKHLNFSKPSVNPQ